MAEREVLALDQDMTIAREEFLRCLPAAVGGAAFVVQECQRAGVDALIAGESRTVGGGAIVAGEAQASGGEGERRWRIELAALPDLAIASVRLPRQRVRVFLSGYDAIATRRFLARFELHFRRGGG